MDNNWSQVKVRVVGFEMRDSDLEQRPFIDYKIEVTKDGKSWTIWRRYNELAALHAWVIKRKLVAEKVIPPFPGKDFFDTRHLKDVAEERKVVLENYLEYLVNIEAVFKTIEMQIFFQLGNTKEPSKSVLIPLPDFDFDLTQAAVTWKILTSLGIDVVFATENGKQAKVNELQLQRGSFRASIIRPVPAPEAKRYYTEMIVSPSYVKPITWADIDPPTFSGLVLIGGHFERVKQMLESQLLQTKVYEFWQLKRPIGAIAQGVLVLARCRHPNTGLSVLNNTTTTGFPKFMEMMFTYNPFLSHKGLYTESNEDEIIKALHAPTNFNSGPNSIAEDHLFSTQTGFTQKDANYLSARFEGDSYAFGKKFAAMVLESDQKASKPPQTKSLPDDDTVMQ